MKPMQSTTSRPTKRNRISRGFAGWSPANIIMSARAIFTNTPRTRLGFKIVAACQTARSAIVRSAQRWRIPSAESGKVIGSAQAKSMEMVRPADVRIEADGSGNLIVCLFEFPSGCRYWHKVALADLPDDLSSFEDFVNAVALVVDVRPVQKFKSFHRRDMSFWPA